MRGRATGSHRGFTPARSLGLSSPREKMVPAAVEKTGQKQRACGGRGAGRCRGRRDGLNCDGHRYGRRGDSRYGRRDHCRRCRAMAIRTRGAIARLTKQPKRAGHCRNGKSHDYQSKKTENKRLQDKLSLCECSGRMANCMRTNSARGCKVQPIRGGRLAKFCVTKLST